MDLHGDESLILDMKKRTDRNTAIGPSVDGPEGTPRKTPSNMDGTGETAAKTRMRNSGDGGIYVRGKTWWCKWRHKGKRFYASTGVRVDAPGSTPEAQMKLAEAVLADRTAPFRFAKEADTLMYFKTKIETLKDLIRETAKSDPIPVIYAYDAYVKSPRRSELSERTLEIVYNDLREFADWIGRKTPMDEITPEIAERYVTDCLGRRDIAPHTFNRKIWHLHHVWKILAPHLSRPVNPWDGITKRKRDSVAREPLSDEEIKAVLDAAGERYGGDLRLLMVVGLNSGMRLGDATTLKWEDVHLDDGFIRVTTQKTGTAAYVPLMPELETALRERLAHLPTVEGTKEARLKNDRVRPGFEAYVLPRLAYRHLKDHTLISHIVNRAFKMAGIETVKRLDGFSRARPCRGFHSFRATWITRLAARGVPQQVIMATVGHTTARTSQHYTHIRESEVLAAFKGLGVKGVPPMGQAQPAQIAATMPSPAPMPTPPPSPPPVAPMAGMPQGMSVNGGIPILTPNGVVFMPMEAIMSAATAYATANVPRKK